jgi:dimethylargininase
VEALRACGLDVASLPPEPRRPDACFVEDTAVVLDGLTILTRPGAPARRPEVEAIAPHLPRSRALDRGSLDGGDVLVAGRTIFVGLSERTDAAGAARLEDLAAPLFCEVRRVPVGRLLHLKTGVTPIGPRTLLQLRGAWPAATFAGFEVIETDEPLGANALAVDGHVLVSAAAPRTARLLAKRGLEVLVVDVGEFHAGDAGLTCLSLLWPYASNPCTTLPCTSVRR